MNPSEEYKRRLEARNRKVEHYKKLDLLIGNLRLATGIVFFAVLWLAAGPRVISGWWLLLPIVVFVVLVERHEYVRGLGRRMQRAAAFYERGLARIEDRWMSVGAVYDRRESANESRAVIDRPYSEFSASHPYAVDLDIFGKGSLFELLSQARTRSGEQALASWLMMPASPDEIAKRQSAVDELRNNLDLREDLAVVGEDVRAAIHPEWMKRWGARPRMLHSRAARLLAPVLSFFMIASLVYYFGFLGSAWFVMLAIGAGAAFALHYRQRVREVTDSVAEPVKDLQVLSLLLERLEKEQWKTEKLRRLRAALDTEGQAPSRAIRKLVLLIEWLNSRLNPFFGAIGAPLLLWSTQFAFAIEQWRSEHGLAIGRWLDTVGELEALCSLSAFAYEHPDDPFPQIVETGTQLEGEDLKHPLLPAAQCIPNSVHLHTDRQVLIISGSNMSGKSTLLRTVGVNAVLAFAGAPVRAKRLRLSILAIGATIRVMDSLQQGTSRFYAEIQRLHDIMELAKKGPALFLLDEILHGTNSHDRAVGAEAVIRGLIQRGAIGLVTTHDLALTKLADALEPRAANFHFEDHLENGRMVFDYRLHTGVVQKSNALALMRAVGLEV